MIKENEISGYAVESITIIESRFSRTTKNISKVKQDVDVDLDMHHTVTRNKAKCKLTAKVTVVSEKKEGDVLASVTITAYGVFKQRVKNPNIEIGDFAALNAYAIIYPFIREHLSTLSLKAGMDVIMLPSVNFVAFLNNRKQQKSIDD